MILRQLLNTKLIQYRTIITVGPNDTVFMAINRLVEHDIASLPVCTPEGNLLGVITERDIVRKCFTCRDPVAKIKVQDVMSKDIVVGNPEDDLDYAISAMKQKRIRHLPIVDNRKVIGMISMRDLIGVQLQEAVTQVRFLSDYISVGSP